MSARAASRSEEEPVRCPVHEPGECGGETEGDDGCGVLAQSRLLDERLLAIEGLVTEVRACLLDNCDSVMRGVSLTAALEAARLLTRSITREVNSDQAVGHGGGEERARWIVLYPKREEQRPPAVLALRRRKR